MGFVAPPQEQGFGDGSPQGKAGVLGGGLSPLIKIKGKKRCFFLKMTFMHNVHDVFFVHKALARDVNPTISGRHWSIIFKNVNRVRAFSMCLKKWAGLEVGWWW